MIQTDFQTVVSYKPDPTIFSSFFFSDLVQKPDDTSITKHNHMGRCDSDTVFPAI